MVNWDIKIFDKYIETLLKWQKSINLIGNNTIKDLWNRHFLDSLSLYPFIKNKNNILDIGSGAGFPGMILSIAGIKNITLIDSDERKCIFLNQIKNLYNLDVNIINDRVENINTEYSCIISRAFAPLDKIIKLTSSIRNNKTEYFLLKGMNVLSEIESLSLNYKFDYELNNNNILKIFNII